MLQSGKLADTIASIWLDSWEVWGTVCGRRNTENVLDVFHALGVFTWRMASAVWYVV